MKAHGMMPRHATARTRTIRCGPLQSRDAMNVYAVGFGGMSGFSRFKSVMNSSPVMVSFL